MPKSGGTKKFLLASLAGCIPTLSKTWRRPWLRSPTDVLIFDDGYFPCYTWVSGARGCLLIFLILIIVANRCYKRNVGLFHLVINYKRTTSNTFRLRLSQVSIDPYTLTLLTFTLNFVFARMKHSHSVVIRNSKPSQTMTLVGA